ncbi:nucleotidyltransferase domain-containing protein [Cupriavidus sp. NPDC089707]|uniref:nucleotidyltransferase domain-containing protein n=1 Tax=Cupriavidus sp. NPDC089707 TaxID=3363963 RepID=UPI00380FF2B3
MAELFGGEQRFALLRALYMSPGKQYAPAELARLTGADSGNVTRWLRRWAEVGLVVRHQDGRNVLYRASESPALVGLTDIVRRSDAVLDDIRAALPEETEVAAIFGSVARGEEKAESDLDVLVLGEDLSSIRINALLKAVGRKHGRDIHASVFSRSEFEEMLAGGNSFAVGVMQQPMILLIGELAHGGTKAINAGT